MATQVDVERIISELTGGQLKPSSSLYWLASTTALFRVLLASAPEGWSFDDLDPTDEETYKKLQAIVEAHSKAERTFRASLQARPLGDGKTGGDKPAVPVPASLQPGAD